jgi:hypothetical protein
LIADLTGLGNLSGVTALIVVATMMALAPLLSLF